MREWLSGGAPPCQGGGRGFDPRLALLITGYPKGYPYFIYSKLKITKKELFIKEREQFGSRLGFIFLLEEPVEKV